MIGERFGIRFTEVVDPKERVKAFNVNYMTF